MKLLYQIIETGSKTCIENKTVVTLNLEYIYYFYNKALCDDPNLLYLEDEYSYDLAEVGIELKSIYEIRLCSIK